MSSALNINMNLFAKIDRKRHIDDSIPMKKRVKIDNVVLVAGLDRIRFPVHRQTMIESSKYFQAMLGPNFREANEKEIVLHDIDGATLQLLINFCYAGRITITSDNIEDLVDAAARMELIPLEQDCCKFLIDNLTIDNCLDVLFIADKYNFTQLNQKTLDFMCEHFEDIPIADMVEINYKNFNELLNYGNYKFPESIVFDRLVRWCGHNERERAKYVPLLVDYIRLECIPDEFFRNEVQPFYGNYDCIQILARESQKRLLCTHIPTRLCRYLVKELYFSLSSYTGIQFLKFNTDSTEWEIFKKIKVGKNRDFGSVFIDGKLYVIGGNSTGSPISKVISYDLSTDNIDNLPNMPEVRSNFTPIAIGKFIYVFGGLTNTYTDKCIRFDTELRVWKSLQSMPYKVRNYQTVVLNGKIYVVGGLTANAVYSNRFCCYDPNADMWTEMTQANFEMSGLVLFKWQNSIYAANSDAILRKYNHESNVWDAIGRIRSNQIIYNAIECNDELYVFVRGPKFGRIKIESTECSVIPICDAPFRTGIECLFFIR